MPHDRQPAFAQPDLVTGEVARRRELRLAAAVRSRVDESVVVFLIELGEGQNLVADQAADPRPLVDRRGVIDRDAHQVIGYFRRLRGYATSPTAIRLQ